jgi:hypothetical protein
LFAAMEASGGRTSGNSSISGNSDVSGNIVIGGNSGSSGALVVPCPPRARGKGSSRSPIRRNISPAKRNTAAKVKATNRVAARGPPRPQSQQQPWQNHHSPRVPQPPRSPQLPQEPQPPKLSLLGQQVRAHIQLGLHVGCPDA